MPDRGKVIEGLKCCRDYLDMGCEVSCYSEDCPYKGKWNCIPELCSNALNLLKEQGTVEPIDLGLSADFITWGCPICKRWLDYDYKYCPYCGKAVKWDG